MLIKIPRLSLRAPPVPCFSSGNPTPEEQADAMYLLKGSLDPLTEGGPLETRWDFTKAVCDWYGVTCDSAGLITEM